MSNLELVKKKIEEGLPGAKVEILDPRKDQIHIKAVVHYTGFKGKSLIEQHRMVYDCLREELKEQVHALGIETHEAEN